MGVLVWILFYITHFNTGSLSLLWFFNNVVVNVVYCGGELTIGGERVHGRDRPHFIFVGACAKLFVS